MKQRALILKCVQLVTFKKRQENRAATPLLLGTGPRSSVPYLHHALQVHITPIPSQPASMTVKNALQVHIASLEALLAADARAMEW
jgi:hypothetical protein